MDKKNIYKFSIVVSIYNSELWIKETIESIIKQSIGMEHIQLILVDDGSTDNSLKICEGYKKIYKNNIEIICKKNGGVASARNESIPYIKGEYVEFLDSDDYISLDTLEKVYAFFKKHIDEIDIISIPMFYFEGRTGKHYLNNKFDKGSRVINLREDASDVFVHINSIFIKSNLINIYRFDETLPTCEDSKMAIQLLLEKQKYGILDNCYYNYRLRNNMENSLSQIAKKNKDWYSKQIINYPLSIYNYCNEKIGYIPDFVKHIIASHLQWRFKNKFNKYNMLTRKENYIYGQLLLLSVKYINNNILDSLTQISEEQKEYIKFFKNNNVDDEIIDIIKKKYINFPEL